MPGDSKSHDFKGMKVMGLVLVSQEATPGIALQGQ